MWFLATTYKIKSHIRKLEQSLSIFMCEEKRGKTNLEGETGVFIEWCESLCNDRSLMKWSLGFDSQCGECVGPSVTVTAFQPRSLATRKPVRATGGGEGPTRNNVFL